MITIASTSKEPVQATVTTDVDPTGNTVKAMFLATGSAAPSTASGSWVTGSWQGTATALTDGRYRTKAWFTITAASLTAGTVYDWWVWVDGASYDPVLFVDTINVI